ncbi:phage repressor protein [Halobellus sp. Atlit-31R]|nr:phage repressor protein [Halobellus sp. Atlit-31R]
MRHSGDWMTLVDDRILEYLRENETGSPTEMKNEGPIRYSNAYIGRRCKTLTEEGLIRHLGNAVYRITEDGEAYLDGELDTENWVYINENGGAATAGTHTPAEEENGQES